MTSHENQDPVNVIFWGRKRRLCFTSYHLSSYFCHYEDGSSSTSRLSFFGPPRYFICRWHIFLVFAYDFAASFAAFLIHLKQHPARLRMRIRKKSFQASLETVVMPSTFPTFQSADRGKQFLPRNFLARYRLCGLSVNALKILGSRNYQCGHARAGKRTEMTFSIYRYCCYR